MTGNAFINRLTAQMSVAHECFFSHLTMTTKTNLRPHLLLTLSVAIAASLCIGSMQHVPYNPFPTTSMGIMAGKTIPQPARVIRMAFTKSVPLMAGKTKSLTLEFQKQSMFRLMGTMTGRALTLGIGGMGILILLLQRCMTGKACAFQPMPQQPPASRSMWLMAGKTFTPPHRLMHQVLCKFFLRILMAFITELRALLIQQALEMRHMGIMAAAAFSLL